MKWFSLVFSICLAISLGTVCFAEEMNATGNLVTIEATNATAQEAVSLTANAETTVAPVVSNAEVAVAETTQPAEETKWIWAEIVSVEPDSNQFTAKYLSYDSDEEKEIVLVTDSNTKFENFKALSEMSAGDSVSVDYASDSSGMSLAKSVSLQKAKPDSEITEVATEETPTPEAAAVEEGLVNAEVGMPVVTDTAVSEPATIEPATEIVNTETAAEIGSAE